MIEKLTDTGKLSGVLSPLLPMLYAGLYYSCSEVGGVYEQNSGGIAHSFISVKNCHATVVVVADDADYNELDSFLRFLHIDSVLSDRVWGDGFTVLSLMQGQTATFLSDGLVVSSPRWKSGQFRSLYNLLATDDNGFESWYPDFSRRVNDGFAYAVCMDGADSFISCAVAPCVYNGTAVIAGVYTAEALRGKGKATLCLMGLLNELYGQGITNVYLWCKPEKELFYQKSGFSAVGNVYIREEM